MKKRLFAVLVSAITIFQCTTVGFAASVAQEQQLEATIQAEIQTAKDELYDLMYDQLEAQGALGHLPYYEEILYPRLEFAVRSQYGAAVNSADADEYEGFIHTYAPNGGVAVYEIEKSTTINCVEWFLDKDNTENFLNKYFSDTPNMGTVLWNMLVDVLDKNKEYPNIGTAVDILLNALSTFDEMRIRDSVDDAGGYVDIFTMDQGGYESSLITGWFQYPYMVLIYGNGNIGEYTFGYFIN